MSERNLVEFFEEWQTGFFLVVGAVLGGGLAVVLVREFVGPPAGFSGRSSAERCWRSSRSRTCSTVAEGRSPSLERQQNVREK